MPEVITNDEGEEKTVYTAEEVEATAIERAKVEADRVAAEKDAEIEKLRKVSAEKTENFKKFNEMTEEERKAHSENEIIQIRRNDKLEEELGQVKTALQQKEEKEKEYAKNTILSGIHHGKEDIKKTIEEKYALLAAMPETTPDEITARANAAAMLAGINVGPKINPIYQGFNGEAPQHKESEDYTEKGDGKVAADMVRSALGLPTDKK